MSVPNPLRARHGAFRCLVHAMTLAPLALAVGCGGATTNTLSATGGSSGSGASSAGGSSTGGSATGGTGGSSASGGSGGAQEAGAPCTSNSDCPAKQVCAFLKSQGCAAQGRCVTGFMVRCNSYAPGCACDGTTISVACTGLPAGYVSKPLAYPGQCDADGGTDGGARFPCGSTLTCDAKTQYCSIGVGGPCCGPPYYTCASIPSQCTTAHTCACIESAVNAQQCSESGGAVTVTFEYP